MIKVLSIAGSDPSAGAGIQADLKTFQHLGVHGMAVVAALTAQSSRGVSAVAPVPPAVLAKQLDTLFSDVRPGAVKTGMLLTAENVKTVAAAVKRYAVKNLIVDPVLRSSSGKMLLRPEGVKALVRDLLPLTLVVTPNIPEAEVLSGIKITKEQDMDFAAGTILDRGPSYVLIKGGHRALGAAVDTLYGGKTVLSFSTPRRKGEFHGTGCVLSSAIAVFIACGNPVEKAVEKAKQVVDSLLKTARPMGKNKKVRYAQFSCSLSEK